jgi:predicted RNase H-like HicB family nuclease
VSCDPEGSWGEERGGIMIDIPYSLVVEATEDPEFFAYYSPDLEGFTGTGHSIEDCIYKARWGMKDFVRMLQEMNLPVPPSNSHPTIVIQNEGKLEVA